MFVLIVALLAMPVTVTTMVSAQDPEQTPMPDDSSTSSGYGGSQAKLSHGAMATSGSSGDDPADCLLVAHHVHDSTDRAMIGCQAR